MGTVVDVVRGARSAIEAARARIDDLNVYPVPDGDTGTNLALTIAAIDDALGDADDRAPAALAAVARRAALLGARGNSGVILSQIIRGLCDVLEGATGVDDGTLAAALAEASAAAYRGVREPVEGTILTVMRAMADAASTAAPGDLDAAVLRAADDAVERTPDLLPILRESGVVDAGGAGLAVIARGALAALRGMPPPALDLPPPAPATVPTHAEEPSRYRYCTSFVVTGPAVSADALEAATLRLGDSVLVVSDGDAVKVHVHTDDPGAALSLGTTWGLIAAVEVADMHAQAAERTQRLSAREEHRATDVVIVVAGAGNAAIARSLGARRVVDGGATMNPSAGDLVDAARSAAADGVVLVPCDANIWMAAHAAAGLAGRDVRVVEVRSIAVGLAALVAYDPTAPSVDNAAAIAGAAARATSGGVARASRSATIDGVPVAAGDWLGFVDERLVTASSDPGTTVRCVMDHLLATGPGIVTTLVGDGADPAIRDLVTDAVAARPEVELDLHDGGQPHFPLLFAAE
jgi:uncharacterized protein